jgi:hypothetical protein
MNGPSRCMAVASLTVCAAFCQAPTAPPAFDVASVKRIVAGRHDGEDGVYAVVYPQV